MKKYLLLFVLAVIAQLGFSQIPLVIEELASMPEQVTNNAVCEGFINGTPYLYSFGGIDTSLIYSGIHSRAWRYNTVMDSWEAIDSLPDDGKIASGASRVGDFIYIFGGYYVFSNGFETSSDKVHRYDIVNNTYLSDGAPIPVPIDDHVQFVYKDSLIYLITGWSDNDNVNNVQIYDPANDNWLVGTPTPGNPLYESFGSFGTLVGDTILYYGGVRTGFNFTGTFEMRKGVIDANDPTLITWSIDTITDIVGYRGASLTIEDSIALFVGGADNGYNFDGDAYDNSGIVDPSNIVLVRFDDSDIVIDSSLQIPMDLRGYGRTDEYTFYLTGGMFANQTVSNKCLKFTWEIDTMTNIQQLVSAPNIWFPNPVSNLFCSDESIDANSIQLITIDGKIQDNWSTVDGKCINVSNLDNGLYFLKHGRKENQKPILFRIQQ